MSGEQEHSASAPAPTTSGEVSSSSGKATSGDTTFSDKLSSGETAATSISSGKTPSGEPALSGKTPSGEPGLKPWADQTYTPPEGRVGNLTAEHQDTLNLYREELRKNSLLVEPRMDDVYLLRYDILKITCCLRAYGG